MLNTCLLDARVVVLIVCCLGVPVCVCVWGGGLKTIIQVFLDILKSLLMFCFYKQLDLASQLNFCMHTLCFLRMYFWESHGSYFFRSSFHYQISIPHSSAENRFLTGRNGRLGCQGSSPYTKEVPFSH